MMVKRQYHCFISGLPDLSLDDSRLWISPREFGEMLKEDLHPDDYRQVELVFMENDNRNLSSYLFSGKTEALLPGNYSPDDFQEQEKLFTEILPSADILPPYMVNVMRNSRQEDGKKDKLKIEHELSEGYYQHLVENAVPFLKAYSIFDFNLKNLVVFIKAGKHDISQEQYITGYSPHASHLREHAGKKLVKDHNFEFFDEILSYTGSGSFAEQEMRYDRLRWRVIEEMIFFEDFSIDRIIAYLLQLLIAGRWSALDKDQGEKKLRQILADSRKEMADEYMPEVL